MWLLVFTFAAGLSASEPEPRGVVRVPATILSLAALTEKQRTLARDPAYLLLSDTPPWR